MRTEGYDLIVTLEGGGAAIAVVIGAKHLAHDVMLSRISSNLAVEAFSAAVEPLGVRELLVNAGKIG